MARRHDRRRRRRSGATLGAPSSLLAEAPPSVDQEANWVISGGGLAGKGPDGEPSRTVRARRRREQDEPDTRPDLAEQILTRGVAEAAAEEESARDEGAPEPTDPDDTGSRRRVRAAFLGLGRRRR